MIHLNAKWIESIYRLVQTYIYKQVDTSTHRLSKSNLHHTSYLLSGDYYSFLKTIYYYLPVSGTTIALLRKKIKLLPPVYCLGQKYRLRSFIITHIQRLHICYLFPVSKSSIDFLENSYLHPYLVLFLRLTCKNKVWQVEDTTTGSVPAVPWVCINKFNFIYLYIIENEKMYKECQLNKGNEVGCVHNLKILKKMKVEYRKGQCVGYKRKGQQ